MPRRLGPRARIITTITTTARTERERNLPPWCSFRWTARQGDRHCRRLCAVQPGGFRMMFFAKHKTEMVSSDEALPGRQSPMPVLERHFVNGRPIRPPFPEGLEQAVFGLGC